MTQKISATKKHLSEIAPQVYHLIMHSDAINQDSYQAGQYLNLCMPNGKDRPFSIASAPQSSGLIELIIRVSNDLPATLDILNYLQQSDNIDIELAMGQCIIPEKQDLCFIAGGTGIAPIRAMLQALSSANDQRQIDLFWGVQGEDDFFLLDNIKRDLKNLKNARLHLVCAKPSNNWLGNTGFVHQCMLDTLPELSQKEIIIGGSMDMVKAVYLDLVDKGVAPKQIHSDMIDIMRQFGGLPAID